MQSKKSLTRCIPLKAITKANRQASTNKFYQMQQNNRTTVGKTGYQSPPKFRIGDAAFGSCEVAEEVEIEWAEDVLPLPLPWDDAGRAEPETIEMVGAGTFMLVVAPGVGAISTVPSEEIAECQ